VLLTGATGFIGRHLYRHLLDHGHPVRALVRPRSAARARLDPRCEVRVAELSDTDAVARAVAGARSVVYAAGTVRGRHFDDFRDANVAGITALVTALRQSGDAERPLVLLSSLAASRPDLSDYARSKHCGEAVLRAEPDLCWIILRPPAVYGPGDVELKGLLELVRRGLVLRPGPADQRLALIHVDDLVRAVAACLAAPAACRHGCYEIDDGKPGGYDWREIAAAVAGRRVLEVGVPGWLLRGLAEVNQRLAEAFHYPPMLTPGKVRELREPRWLCDNSAFSDAAGWHPRVTLEQGAAALLG